MWCDGVLSPPRDCSRIVPPLGDISNDAGEVKTRSPFKPPKPTRSATFLRREVVPRREAVLSIAQGVEELNNANLAAQSAEVTSRHTALRDDLRQLTWQTVLLGLTVALVVVFRLRFLERRSDEAERHMRELSQQLVNTQEEERKSLSRELHGHVAQVLTGLRMELGRVERIAGPVDARVSPAVAECKRLVDDMFNTVRGLALGLRPSMPVDALAALTAANSADQATASGCTDKDPALVRGRGPGLLNDDLKLPNYYRQSVHIRNRPTH
jgi:hypothetical protein